MAQHPAAWSRLGDKRLDVASEFRASRPDRTFDGRAACFHFRRPPQRALASDQGKPFNRLPDLHSDLAHLLSQVRDFWITVAGTKKPGLRRAFAIAGRFTDRTNSEGRVSTRRSFAGRWPSDGSQRTGCAGQGGRRAVPTVALALLDRGRGGGRKLQVVEPSFAGDELL